MTPCALPGGAEGDGLERSARFSPCRTYRYGLWRRWGPGHTLMVVGLNPSTADETQDDPTIRRCIGFARAWGFGALRMANLFAYRAISPERLRQAADPIGPENDRSLQELADGAGLVLAAWGSHGTFLGRNRAVRRLLPDLHILRLTRTGEPAHPLYLPADLTPQPWSPP